MRRDDYLYSDRYINSYNFLIAKFVFYIEDSSGVFDEDTGDLSVYFSSPNVNYYLKPENITITCQGGTTKKLLKLS